MCSSFWQSWATWTSLDRSKKLNWVSEGQRVTDGAYSAGVSRGMFARVMITEERSMEIA